MKKMVFIEGMSFRLRLVTVEDAEFIVKLRLQDAERNKYINPISSDVNQQQLWIENYLDKSDDYYFVVEDIFSGNAVGLIGIYNIENGCGEWGRWVVSSNSMAAVESIDLLYKIAFRKLGLKELYSRTIVDNVPVVTFHDNLPQKKRNIIEKHVVLSGVEYDVIEHYVDSEYYDNELQYSLEAKCEMVFKRTIRHQLGGMNFHHIGVATNSIEAELSTYRLLGYKREGVPFIDENQGIKGQFIVCEGQPRLELLENLEGRDTLTKWIESGVKNYHFAYTVNDIEAAIKVLGKKRFRVISPMKASSYFGKRICFLVMPNRFLIELIEN